MNLRWGKGLLIGVSIAYPILVFILLVLLDVSPRVLSLSVFVIVCFQFLQLTSEKKKTGGWNVRNGILSVVLGGSAVVVFITNSETFLRFYPVIVGLTLLGAFCFTLIKPPTMILRFAVLQDKTLPDSLEFPSIQRYCKKITIIWCLFFVCNTSIAAYTTFFTSRLVWSVYNGFISYLLIGILFFGEMLVRRLVIQKK